MSRLRVAAVVWSALMIAACGTDGSVQPTPNPSPNPIPPDDTEVLQSELQRNPAPSVPSADLATLVDGNSALSFSLYDRFRKESDKNFFYSPLSISQALAMAWAGARGQTEKEMASTLHFGLDQSRLHPAMNELDLTLQSRGKGAKAADGKAFRLRLSNAIWGQRGYHILQPFLDVLAQSYGAGLRVLNFKEQPDLAKDTINAWVARQTEDKIKDLIDSLSPDTRLVLTNTIYFNAAWSKVFDQLNTKDQSFNRLDGSTVTAPAMNLTDYFSYAAGPGWQAIELPYDGNELSMLLVVPDAGNFAQTEAQLCSNGVAGVVGRLKNTRTDLTLPKWKVSSKWRMKELLQTMGMVESFDGTRANFTGINGGIEPLWIAQVIHQSFISVNEQGTEAAAATAVIMPGGSMPVTPVPLVVDRPFIYVIRDLGTGTILFAGRVTDPTAS